jgi:hypothetical protein
MLPVEEENNGTRGRKVLLTVLLHLLTYGVQNSGMARALYDSTKINKLTGAILGSVADALCLLKHVGDVICNNYDRKLTLVFPSLAPRSQFHSLYHFSPIIHGMSLL